MNSFAFQRPSLNAPEPALCDRSQPWPRSPSVSWASTRSLSITEATPADSAFRIRPGDSPAVTVMRTCDPSTTSTRSSTFAAFQPNCVKMKAGVLLSFTTRSSENSTSSGRTGLPE